LAFCARTIPFAVRTRRPRTLASGSWKAPPGCTPDESANLGIAQFLQENWPFGDPVPAIYYDPRTVMPGSSINLHAKCVVVDDRFALIGSANFTHNAQARNIELGVLIDDPMFARDLSRQWMGLVEAGLVCER
jgi:phosphatidylserine/phosphatidylglycerophosphate/cardiolipin synthase-like enzyme